MEFENKLIPGTLIKRYKRFFVDIKLNNKIVTAHCPNTGSMMGLLKKGNKVWVTKSNNIKRKLRYTLQIIETNKNKVGINTHITNKIVREALEKKFINFFNKKITIQAEKKFNNNTRFDFLISDNEKKTFIEVKNVTLKRKNKVAEFPDAITTRGLKHLKELINAKKKGYNSLLLFLIQRDDCKLFKIASDIDLDYLKNLKIAIKQKVNIAAYDCKFLKNGIILNKKIKLKI
tara:strand:- start:243 stop:938 length:696 start_codon:yes stop_codon:yes gene_type:complete